MASGSDEESTVRPLFREVLSDPTTGREQLPQLLELLDVEDPSTRLNTAWALCLVAHHCPDTVGAITRRLAKRLAAESEDRADRFEVELAFAYLRNQFSEEVTEILSDVAKESAVKDVRERAQERAGGFARSNYIGGNMLSRDVGRTKVPERNDGDPRSVYQNRSNDGEEPAEMKELSELLDSGYGTPDERQASGRDQRRDALLDDVVSDASIEEIEEESSFDRLHVVAPGIEGRYASIYRTRAVRAGSEDGIAINLFRVPDSDHERFAADVAAQLENWEAIADNDSIVSLYDWSVSPTPWTATDYSLQTLYDRLDVGLAEATRNALTLAKTISYAHQRGVIHSGIDPYNVVYSDGFMANRDQPLVKNFGLMNAMRQYFEPSTLLDPRYAAPEYFDRSYGDIDHTTDIYQLGAVVYRLFTGRPPFEGDYNEVRTGILNSPPTAPSELDPDIPGVVDDVIRKAMAKQKLTRYETATQLVSELQRATDD